MGTSATRAKNKYQANNYDRVNLLLPKGAKDEYRRIAETGGESLNSFIVKAIEQRIEREGLACGETKQDT